MILAALIAEWEGGKQSEWCLGLCQLVPGGIHLEPVTWGQFLTCQSLSLQPYEVDERM